MVALAEITTPSYTRGRDIMKLLIDRVRVRMAYLPFEGYRAGAVLQLLLELQGEAPHALHRVLADELKPIVQGLMDREEIVNGHTEIRVLNHTMLEAIDLVRMLGHGVGEIHPHAN